jgi:uncharacterized RmlC-like cupin family protein
MPNDKPVCRVVRAQAAFKGKQGLDYRPAISAETVNSRALHMQLLTMPPGARAKAHKHESHETALYTLSGHAGCWWGERLEEYSECHPGDFMYIPAGVPHLPFNLSPTEPCTAVVARTDPNEQESVVLLPELEPLRR